MTSKSSASTQSRRHGRLLVSHHQPQKRLRQCWSFGFTLLYWLVPGSWFNKKKKKKKNRKKKRNNNNNNNFGSNNGNSGCFLNVDVDDDGGDMNKRAATREPVFQVRNPMISTLKEWISMWQQTDSFRNTNVNRKKKHCLELNDRWMWKTGGE